MGIDRSSNKERSLFQGHKFYIAASDHGLEDISQVGVFPVTGAESFWDSTQLTTLTSVRKFYFQEYLEYMSV